MRKILITILVVLLIILAYFTIFQGISIGSFKILGTSQIAMLSDELNTKKDEANRKVATDLQNKKEEVSTSVNNLLQNKESYYDVANISSETDLSNATKEEVYSSEYLYLKIGGHAREEGVKLKFYIMSTDNGESNVKDLEFVVTGKYVGILDFISSIEEDSDLNFKIENFKMKPNAENLEATFKVTGIRVEFDEIDQAANQNQGENVQ